MDKSKCLIHSTEMVVRTIVLPSAAPTKFRVCPNCGAPVARKGGTYCSYACWQQDHRVTRTCPNCGRIFTTARSNIERGRMIACSRSCRNLLSRTVPVIEHNGITYRKGKKYYYSNRHKLLHRVIWEEHHGPIPANFVIRHLDGDIDNNDISNLELESHRDAYASILSKTQPPCLECDRPARSRGLCHRHYQQLRAKDTALADIHLVYILVGDFY